MAGYWVFKRKMGIIDFILAGLIFSGAVIFYTAPSGIKRDIVQDVIQKCVRLKKQKSNEEIVVVYITFSCYNKM